MAFTEAELGISQDEIDKIKEALANDNQADAFPNALAEAESIVTDHCVLWQVPADTRRRYWRALAMHALYSALKSVPDAVRDDRDKAMAALEQIRDGKSGYEEATSVPGRFSGAWGSSPQFDPGP